MKAEFLKLIVLMFLIGACGNGDDNNGSSTDTAIIEIGTSDGDENMYKTPDNLKEAGGEFSTFLENFNSAKLPFEVFPEQEPDYEKIPLDFQIKFLDKAEGLDANELRDMEPYAKYQYFSKPLVSNKFSAIIYVRSEMSSSYYILCTFNHTGKFLSSIEFAYYQLIGAGPQAGQEFSMTGKINESNKITTVSDVETTYYQIKDDGVIEKLK
jgi:hypothetical protein